MSSNADSADRRVMPARASRLRAAQAVGSETCSRGRTRGRRRANLVQRTVSPDVEELPGQQLGRQSNVSTESSSIPAVSTGVSLILKPHENFGHDGTLEGAKALGVSLNKWVLICITSRQNARSYNLSKEIMEHQEVINVITNNFVFLHAFHGGSEGNRISTYYELHNRVFPIVIAIDPRNGEELRNFNSYRMDLHVFLEELVEFLSENTSFEARDAFVRRIYNPRLYENGNTQDYATGSQRKRQLVCEPSPPSPKREKVEATMEEQLSDETYALTVRDVEEWKSLVNPDGDPCTLRLYLPVGESCTCEVVSMTMSTKLYALFMYISARGLNPADHAFVLSFPIRVYSMKFHDISLINLGFTRTEVVHVHNVHGLYDV